MSEFTMLRSQSALLLWVNTHLRRIDENYKQVSAMRCLAGLSAC